MALTSPFELSSLDGDDGFVVIGRCGGDGLGARAAGAGDVNGDGIDDVIFGQSRADPNGHYSGQAVVLYGSTAPFAASFELSDLDPSLGFVINGQCAQDGAGAVVRGVGDVNGDDIADVLLSAPRSQIRGPNSGAAYVVFGRVGGHAGPIELGSLASSDGFAIHGVAFEQVGYSAAAVGDVNGDGLADVALGALSVAGTSGAAAYVVFGRTGAGAAVELSALAATDGFVIESVTIQPTSSYSVGGIVDFNGDGLDDVIVGQGTAGPSEAGRAWVIFGQSSGLGPTIDLAALDPSAGFAIHGAAPVGAFAFQMPVTGAGDLNQDGFDDIVVGRPRADGNGTDSGAVYVVFGRAAAPAGPIELSALAPGEGFDVRFDASVRGGAAVSAAGDVNDDGIDDLLFSAAASDLHGTDSGAAFVLFGRTAGLAGHIDADDLDGYSGIALHGNAAEIFAGYGSTGIGDFNGDGIGDLTVGAPGGDAHGSLTGQAYIVFGSTTPLPLAFPEPIALSDLEPAVGFAIDGASAGDFSGRSVAGAGDINGDGIDDVIVGGALANRNGEYFVGISHVVYGRPGGLGGPVDLADLDLSDGFAITGAYDRDYSGASVDGVGDLNGDGRDDLVIGAPAWTISAGLGGAYVLFGRSADFGGPVDLGTLAASDGLVLRGPDNGQAGYAVAGAGDLNGDGIADLIVGAPHARPDEVLHTGVGYVVFGRSEGLSGTLDLTSLGGTTGLQIRGLTLFDSEQGIGVSVDGAGDVNGDGIDDVIVAMREAYADRGESYVVFGRTSFAGPVDVSALDGTTGFAVRGAEPLDYSGQVAGIGDINGDDIDDFAIGAIGFRSEGATFVVYGRSDFAPLLQLSTFGSDDGFFILGACGDDITGRAVQAAGDVNGDGIADLIVSSPGGDAGGSSAGTSHVIFGRDAATRPDLALSALDPSDGFAIHGVSGSFSGASAAGAGDVNDDGFDDVIVGAALADPLGRTNAGSSYVIYGRSAPPNDEEPPDTTITSSPPDPTNDATPDFAFTSEPDATFEVAIDGGGFASVAGSTYTQPTDLGDGLHTFQVRATDEAGNTDSTPAAFTFTVDTLAPDTTITGTPADPTNDPTPSFVFTSDPGATFQVAMDGGVFDTVVGGSYAHPTNLGDGLHTFQVRATDAAGNTDATPAAFTFTVDTIAPDTTITGTPPDPTNDATPTFTFTSDPDATFQVAVDAGSFDTVPGSTFTQPTNLGDGLHTFQVRATDAAGNTDLSPAVFTFTVDTIAPDTTLATVPSDPTNDPTPSFAFTSEPGSTFQVAMDDGVFDTVVGGSHTHPTNLGDGLHTFQVRATDAAGNTDATPAAFTFTVDTAAPDTTITGAPPDPTNDATPSFTFTSDPDATFQVAVDAGAFDTVPGSTFTQPTDLGEGTHTFRVRAIDASGNTDLSPAAFTFTVDTIAPDTTLTGMPSDPTNDPTPGFAFTSDPGATFEAAMDDGAFETVPGGSHTHPTSLGDGPHTFRVRATDAAGNTDATPAVYTFTVDTDAPDTTILSAPHGAIAVDDLDFDFGSDDPTAGFQVALDGGGFTSATGTSQSYLDLPDGVHTFRVRAVDPAGNVDPSPAAETLTIDTGDPDTTIVSGPSGPTPSDDPAFAFTSDETGVVFEVQLDGGGFASVAGAAHGYSNLADGTHTFQVRARDGVGHVDGSPAQRVFMVDTTAPGPATVTSFADDTGTTGDGVTTDRSLTVFGTTDPGTTVQVFRDGVAVGMATVSGGTWSFLDPATQTFGLHRYTARAEDAAGNDAPLSAPLELFVIDPAASGGAGPDLLIGTAGANVIQGLDGNDTIFAEAGNDTVRGGNGNDSLNGGDGADRLEGANGTDTLRGGGDNDSVYGENGNDRLFGENGNDRLEGGTGADLLDGGGGNDTVFGGGEDDTLIGGLGADQLFGDAGGDLIDLGADASRDTVFGTIAHLADDTIDGFVDGMPTVPGADMVFVTGMTSAQRKEIDGDILDAQGRLFMPGGTLTFAGHAGAEVDAVLVSGGVQIWLV